MPSRLVETTEALRDERVAEAVARLRRQIEKPALWREPEVAKKLLTIHGDVFIDIGACVGFYTFLLKNNFKAIYAVEPARSNWVVASKYHLGWWGGDDRIHLIQEAIGARAELRDLYWQRHYEGECECGGYSLIVNPAALGSVRVRTVPLDEFVERFQLKDRTLDLVKVDVEGAELEVLQGANVVRSHVKRWLIEAHNDSLKNQVRSELEAWGLQVTELPQPQNSRSSHLYAEQ